MFEFLSRLVRRRREAGLPGAAAKPDARIRHDEILAQADAMSRSMGYAAAARYCKQCAIIDDGHADADVLLQAARFEWVAQDYASAARTAQIALLAGGNPTTCLDMVCTATAAAEDWDACQIAAERLTALVPHGDLGRRWLMMAREAKHNVWPAA